jgi:hypothetical protein
VSGHGTPFWDRDIDLEGRVIRADVRCAAQEIWSRARRLTESLFGEPSDAAEILETCVSRVSHYMDERKQGLFTQSTNALLMAAFRHSLLFRAQDRLRLQPIENARFFDPKNRPM